MPDREILYTITPAEIREMHENNARFYTALAADIDTLITEWNRIKDDPAEARAVNRFYETLTGKTILEVVGGDDFDVVEYLNRHRVDALQNARRQRFLALHVSETPLQLTDRDLSRYRLDEPLVYATSDTRTFLAEKVVEEMRQAARRGSGLDDRLGEMVATAGEPGMLRGHSPWTARQRF